MKTKTIAFTNSEELALIDVEDWPLVKDYKWSVIKSYSSHKVKLYAVACYYENGLKKSVLMHRLILKPDSLHVVDHINHNGLDNRRFNLRELTYSENAQPKNIRQTDPNDSRFKPH